MRSDHASENPHGINAVTVHGVMKRIIALVVILGAAATAIYLLLKDSELMTGDAPPDPRQTVIDDTINAAMMGELVSRLLRLIGTPEATAIFGKLRSQQ